MKKLFFLLLILWWCFLVFYVPYNNVTNFTLTEDTTLSIDSGETFYSLPQKLWLNETYFKVYLKLNTPDFTLQKWKYALQAGQSLDQIFESLKTPIPEDSQVTILEGWNIYDIDNLLASKWLIQSWEFTSQAEGESFYKYKYDFSFIADASTLEGFLYPDTYNINPNNFSVDSFIKTMLSNFETKVVKNLGTTYGSLELLDIITMASIVEKEEKRTDAKALVAGILKKRVQEGWMIGADATVCYPYKLIFSECTPSFIWQHITDKNQYNTRTMQGLPITPIANPSWETINATINSESSPYYFYLHDSQWGIHYATTNAEHEANKAKYIY